MDFYYRAIESINIPKIVIFRFHNLKLKDIRQYLSANWKNIFENIRHHLLHTISYFTAAWRIRKVRQSIV